MAQAIATIPPVSFRHYREELPEPSALPCPRQPVRVRRIEKDEDFSALRETWDGLIKSNHAASIFMTWEWMYPWWQHFGKGRELCILVAERAAEKKVIGIAPLYVQHERLLNIIDVRKLVFLGNERVSSDFVDFVLMPGKEHEALAAFFRFLRKSQPAWDVLEIGAVDVQSLTFRFLSRTARRGYRFFEKARFRCPYAVLPDSYDRYLEGLGAKTRRDILKKTRHMANSHTVTVQLNGDGAGPSVCLDTLFTLHQEGFSMKRYGLRQHSNFGGDDIRKFHAEIIRRFYENGWLRLYLLACDGAPVASLYAFGFKNRLYCYQSGFAGSWYRWSPGTVLAGMCIKDCIFQGYDEFHYLRGNEPYKQRWAKKAAVQLTLIGLNRTMRGAFYAAYYGGRQRLKNCLMAQR